MQVTELLIWLSQTWSAELLRRFLRRTKPEARQAGGLAFVFQGRHDVSPGLGQNMYREERVFRNSVQRSLQYCEKVHNIHLLGAFERQDDRSDRPKYDSYFGVLMAIMHIALCDLWQSKGIEPQALIGFSMGDRTLQYFNKTFTWQETLDVAHFHEVAHNRVPTKFKFIRCSLSLDQLEHFKKKSPVELSVIAEYGLRSLILSCDALSADRVFTLLEQNGIEHNIVGDAAFHTSEFSQFLKDWPTNLLERKSGNRRFAVYLSAEGGLLPNNIECNSTYLQWTMSTPALFISAFNKALLDGYHTFVMIGADSILTQYMTEAAAALNKEILILESMRGNAPESEIFNESLRKLKKLH